MLKSPHRLGFDNRHLISFPHPKKAHFGGEDAYCASSTFLGIADGVGSQRDRGIEAEKFPRALMQACYEISEEGHFLDDDRMKLRTLLQRAYDEAKSVPGSSTCVLASIHHDIVDVLCLGDSTCLILRNLGSEVVFRTEEQMKGWDKPRQLGTGSADAPDDAIVNRVEVHVNDVLFLGSDGIFDNVYDSSIQEILNHHILAALAVNRDIDQRAILNSVAHEIVDLAVDNSRNKKAATPYSERCLEEGFIHNGGKVDDITLLVAAVDKLHLDSGDRTLHGLPAPMPPYTGYYE